MVFIWVEGGVGGVMGCPYLVVNGGGVGSGCELAFG